MSSECGEKGKLKKGAWTFEEDIRLLRYIKLHGHRRWSTLAKATGLQRCGRSCRLRWVNYLRPGIKRGNITPQEERIIIDLHSRWGSRWSLIAERIPGRTDNEIKNYWRSHLKKKLQNPAKTQNIGDQNCSPEAQLQGKQVILPQQSLRNFTANAIKAPLSYENNHNDVLVRMETPTDKLCIEEMIGDMDQVQIEALLEASSVGTNEVERSIENDMGIARHDAVELSRMLYSFPWGIPIDSYTTAAFEASCSANPVLMYPTHECESDLGSDIMLWNMELDTPFQSSLEDFTGNAVKAPLSYQNNHNHGSVNVETPTDKLCIDDVIRDMEQVQVQVEASVVGTSHEVKGSTQNDTGTAGHDVVELSRMLYSFPSGVPIESYATAAVFEASCYANPELMYPTHESDIMRWNMELDTPFHLNGQTPYPSM